MNVVDGQPRQHVAQHDVLKTVLWHDNLISAWAPHHRNPYKSLNPKHPLLACLEPGPSSAAYHGWILSGNSGFQPETREGEKLDGYLHKQRAKLGAQKNNTDSVCWVLIGEIPSRHMHRHPLPHPHTPWCVWAPFLHGIPRRCTAKKA